MIFIGEISAISAAILWSFSSYVFTSVTKKIGPIQLNFWRLILAAVFMALTLMIAGISLKMSANQYIYLSLSGFIGLVIGDGFLFKAFKELGPRTSMLIMSCNPAVAALMAYLILGEYISTWGVFGMLITLSGIYTVISRSVPSTHSHNKINTIGIISGFLAAGGQGIGLIFAKLAFLEGNLNGLAATQVRIVSAIVFLIPIIILKQYRMNPKKIFFSSSDLSFKIILGSIIGPYLGITLSYISIIYTKIGIASTLMSLVPIIMIPISIIFYKEKLSAISIIGAFIAVIGVSILFLR